MNVPRGWNASSLTDNDWTVTSDATDWNNTIGASDVTATLKHDVASVGSVQFHFYGTYHGDLLNYYTFHASLSNGADAESNLIVRSDGWAPYMETFAAPIVAAHKARRTSIQWEETPQLARGEGSPLSCLKSR